MLNAKKKVQEKYKKNYNTCDKKTLEAIQTQVNILRSQKFDYDLELDEDMETQQRSTNLYNERAKELAFNR